MTGKVLDRLINDAGLTPDALRITLYVERLGAGWHRIKSPALRILLNGRGEKPIRTAYENAGERGWLACLVKGGQGGGWYRFRTPEETPEESAEWLAQIRNDSLEGGIPSTNDSPTGVIARRNGSQTGGIQRANDSLQGGIHSESGSDGLNDSPGGGIPAVARASLPPKGEGAVEIPTSPPSPSPTAGARDRVERGVEELRTLLGPQADAVEVFATSAAHPPGWAGHILGWYHPPGMGGSTDGGGTQLLDVQGVPPERIPAVLATAMSDYALKGEPLEGRHFRGYVRKAANDERTHSSPAAGAASTARPAGVAARDAHFQAALEKVS